MLIKSMRAAFAVEDTLLDGIQVAAVFITIGHHHTWIVGHCCLHPGAAHSERDFGLQKSRGGVHSFARSFATTGVRL
jgi:hypothetical protein